MRSTVKKFGNDKSYAAEVFDMYKIEQQKQTGISIYSAAEYFDFSVIVAFLAENSKTVEYKDIWYPAAIVKFLKSLESGKISGYTFRRQWHRTSLYICSPS